MTRSTEAVRTNDLQALLARVEAAEGPDRELDRLLVLALVRGVERILGSAPDGSQDGFVDRNRVLQKGFAFTASLDAALALVELQKGSGIDAAQMLHEALEDMANGGWRDDPPIGPQIALYLIAALLKALIQQEAEHGR